MLEAPYQQVSRLLQGIQINDWANVTPARFAAKSDTVYFLNNAQDFLFVNAPLTLIFFVLAWLSHKKITCWKLPVFLAPFATFSYLLVTLFGDNIQYLSFRAFQQIRFIVPHSFVETISIALAIIALFVIVVCGCALYLLIWTFDRKQFRTEVMKQRLNSFALLTITIGGRAFTGFLHAYIDNERYRMLGLVIVNMGVLAITARYYLVYKVKRSLAVYLYNLIAKVLVNLVLAI